MVGGLTIKKRVLEALKSIFPFQVLQFSNGTLIVNERFLKKIKDGWAFSVSKRFEAVAAGASVDFYFENPSTNTNDVNIVVIEVLPFGQCWVDIYRGNSGVSAGTDLTPVNLNHKSSNTSNVIVKANPTITTLGTKVHETVAPGGRLVRAVGSAVEVGEANIMGAGDNLLVRVTNQSGADTDLSIRAIWWEE